MAKIKKPQQYPNFVTGGVVNAPKPKSVNTIITQPADPSTFRQGMEAGTFQETPVTPTPQEYPNFVTGGTVNAPQSQQSYQKVSSIPEGMQVRKIDNVWSIQDQGGVWHVSPNLKDADLQQAGIDTSNILNEKNEVIRPDAQGRTGAYGQSDFIIKGAVGGEILPQNLGRELSGYAERSKALLQAGAPLPITPITTGVPTGEIKPPSITQPTAPVSTASFISGLTENEARTRQSFEAAKNTQIADAQTQIDQLQKKINDFTTAQQGVIDQQRQELPEPLKLGYEKAQQELLYVKKNFEDNQKLTDELSSLLTEGNQLINQQKGTTSLSAIKNPRLQQTISDVTARAGVIQAVMDARNGQISQAYNMIDRTVREAGAYRQDQLDYYKNVYNLYSEQKGIAQNKLLSLTSDQKKAVEDKISLLESDMKRAQASGDKIKELISDPKTAKIAADAGITVNDTPEQIGQKFATQTVKEQNKSLAQDMGTATKYVNNNGQFFRVSDGKVYENPAEFFADAGVKSFEDAYKKGLVSDNNQKANAERDLVKQLMAKYPDAFILSTDSIDTAKSKLSKSQSYIKDVTLAKTQTGEGKEGGLTPAQINTTVNQIAGAFDNEQIVKSYNTTQEGYQTISSIGVNTKSPADDIAFIYAFAKIMDPNSVVREGEYATIQKYAQTWSDNFGFKAQRIFSNTNFLSSDAKQKMLGALKPKVDTIEKQYTNLKAEYQRQINDAYAGKPRQITEYGQGNIPEQPITQQQEGFNYNGFISDELKRGSKPDDILKALEQSGNYTRPTNRNIDPATVLEQLKKKSSSVSKVDIPESSRIASVHNNPGNLMFVGQKGATQGEQKKGGGFWAKFTDPAAGFTALVNQIKLDASRGLNLASFINKYAPPSENATTQYLNQIATMLGVKPTEKIASVDQIKLAKAIALKESGTKIS